MGKKNLLLTCTQLGYCFTPQYKTQKDKKRVVTEWCEFLTPNPANKEIGLTDRFKLTIVNILDQDYALF